MDVNNAFFAKGLYKCIRFADWRNHWMALNMLQDNGISSSQMLCRMQAILEVLMNSIFKMNGFIFVLYLQR